METPINPPSFSLLPTQFLDQEGRKQPSLNRREGSPHSYKRRSSSGPTRVARRVSRCVWPVNCRNSCNSVAHLGRICFRHLERVHSMAGTLTCAWPGCTRRAWDRKGLCSFHRDVLFGLIDC